MTENEAKEWIRYLGNQNLPYDRSPKSRKLACDIAIQALSEIQQYRAIGTIEEFKAYKEKNEEVEIPEPQGNEIVAGIMLPNVKGKAVVSLSDLHDILMDVGGKNIRDKVFEQIYNRDVIIGLKDVIEKWEERKSMQNNCKYWNAEHEDCALSCEEIRTRQ